MNHNKNKKQNARFETGQSLIEVIIASVVGIMVVTALTFATIFSLRNANFAKTSAQATKLAQEGIERVRTGRDQNQTISGFEGSGVSSWNGNATGGPIWSYSISGGCDNPPAKCYFNVSSNGLLSNIAFAFTPSPSVPFPSLVESVPSSNQVFRRFVLLSDDPSAPNQKTITVVVTWTDTTGPHESRLTTILRNLLEP